MKVIKISILVLLLGILLMYFYMKFLSGCIYKNENILIHKILNGYSLDNMECLLNKLSTEILPNKSNNEKLKIATKLTPLIETDNKTYIYDWFKYGGIDDEDEYNEKKVEIRAIFYRILKHDTIYFPLLDSLYLKYKNDDFYAYDIQMLIIHQIQQNDTFMNKERYFKYIDSRVDTGVRKNLNLLLKYEYLHPSNSDIWWKTFNYPDSLYALDSIAFY